VNKRWVRWVTQKVLRWHLTGQVTLFQTKCNTYMRTLLNKIGYFCSSYIGAIREIAAKHRRKVTISPPPKKTEHGVINNHTQKWYTDQLCFMDAFN